MVLRSITQRRNSTDTCKSSPPIMIMADHLLHFHSEAAESPPSTVSRTITNRSNGARRASITQLIFGPSSASNTPLTSRRATATAGDLSKSSSGFAHDSNNDNNNIYASLVREFEQHSPSPSNRRSWSQQLTLSSVTNHHHQSKTMGRCMRVVVAGPKEVGKTAILNQLACLNDITNEPYIPTIDDTYSVQMDGGERPPREVIVFHDTAGVPSYATVELRRPYIQVADAFLLIYSVCDGDSFNRVDLLKKFIDRQFGKEKKEVPIVVLGNMIDRPKREVDFNFVNNWAQRERVKFYEVTATDRRTLVDPIIFLASRYFHPPKESKFSLTKKLKPEKSGASIVMDL